MRGVDSWSEDWISTKHKPHSTATPAARASQWLLAGLEPATD